MRQVDDQDLRPSSVNKLIGAGYLGLHGPACRRRRLYTRREVNLGRRIYSILSCMRYTESEISSSLSLHGPDLNIYIYIYSVWQFILP